MAMNVKAITSCLGYQQITSLSAAAGLTVRAQFGGVAVVLRGAPPVRAKNAGVVAVELAVRL